MSKTAINDLQVLIRKLQDQRQAHLDAIAVIEAAFGSLGIKPPKRRGRPRGAKKTTAKKIGKAKFAKKIGKAKAAKKGRRRKKFKMSATVSVLGFVKKAGKKGVTGTQITKYWKTAGRGAGCYNTIGTLVKAKKLKRQAIKGKKRGSIYVAG